MDSLKFIIILKQKSGLMTVFEYFDANETTKIMKYYLPDISQINAL